MRFAGELLTQSGPDFGGMSGNTMEYRGKEKNAVHAAESQVNQYGLKSVADLRAAEEEAAATKYAGQQAGQAAMASGLMGGIGSLAGGFGGSMFGSGNNTYTGTGGAGQGSLLAPLSTGKNATSKLSSFLSGADM